MLMLAVDVEQQGRKDFYLRDIACLAVDAADAAGSGDLSGNNHLSLLRLEIHLF